MGTAWRYGKFSLLGFATALVGLLAVVVDSPLVDQWQALLAINVLVDVGLLVTAGYLAGQPGQRGTACLLGLAGLSWMLSWERAPLPGPLPFLLTITGPLLWLFTSWALLRYPGCRLSRAGERAFIAAAAGWLVIGHTLATMMLSPEWFPERWPAGTWWPTIIGDRYLYSLVQVIKPIVDAVIVIGYLVLGLRRLRRLGGIDRWLLAPLRASMLAAGMAVVAAAVPPLTGSDDLWRATSLLESCSLLLIPGAFAVIAGRTGIARGRLVGVVSAGGRSEPVAAVTAELREVLGDPNLSVARWSPDSGGYVDDRGLPVVSGTMPADRLLLPVDLENREPLGLIITDRSLARHPQLVEAVASAVRLALRSERLQIALQAQLEQLHRAERQIAEAGAAERRRLERDLHDGVQQRLLALTLNLAEIKARRPDPAAIPVIERARSEVQAALAELRDLAHGGRPAALELAGLKAAVAEVATRLRLTVRVDIPARRWPAMTETTAYYVICEALTNVAKHAGPSNVRVTVQDTDGEVVVAVVDEGRGGADPTGAGLCGLVTRVGLIGGRIEIESTSRGTSIEAGLPYR